MKKIFYTLLLLFISNFVIAQATNELNKNDLMHREGRINVVVVVLTIILIGIFLYVRNLDKKICKLEKEN